MSVYDQKITGEHTVSFRIAQSDAKDTAGFVLRSVTFAKSTVPVLYFDIDESQGSISTMNNSPEHDDECYGSVTIEVPDGYECEYADKDGKTDNIKTGTYELDYIRGRGNSTWWTDKKPYKLKFTEKQDLFHMGKNKHWVLLADYYDPSHMRNKATYWLGKELGMEYTPECVYVDVVMNGEYYGSYLLCEHVRLDSNRVDLDDLEKTPDAADEPTITGGYLLSLNPEEDDEGKKFETSRFNSFLIESPEFEDYENEAQYNYIKNYVQSTEDAIYGNNFQANGKSYRDYMDITSAVKYWWVQEFSANGDAFWGSTYLYKKRDGKLFWGPLWDFDYVAWGNNDYDCYGCEGWNHKENMWFKQLFKDSAFTDEVIAEWDQVKKAVTDVCEDDGKLDQYAGEIAYSMNYNADLYGTNYDEEYGSRTFEQNVEQLKQWMAKRVDWVDKNISQLEAKYFTVTFKNGKKTLSKQSVYNGETAVFPKPGTKKGYVFGGWYMKDKRGKSYPVTNETCIYENMTVYAKWIAKKDVKPVKKIVLGYDSMMTTLNPEWDWNDEEFITVPYEVIGGSNLPGQIQWASSNKKVVVPLEDGQFKVVGNGTATLTASAESGKVKAKCKVSVVKNREYYSVQKLSLNKTKANVKKGGYTVLSATRSPKDNDGAEVTWICADKTVSLKPVGDKCIVRGKKKGAATIIALVYGETGMIVKSCTVNVTVPKKTAKK